MIRSRECIVHILRTSGRASIEDLRQTRARQFHRGKAAPEPGRGGFVAELRQETQSNPDGLNK